MGSVTLHTSNTPQVILVWSVSLVTHSGIHSANNKYKRASPDKMFISHILNILGEIRTYFAIKFYLSSYVFSFFPSPEPPVLLSTSSSLQSILCLSDGRSDHHSGGAFGRRLLQLSGSEHRWQCDHQSPAGGYRRWDGHTRHRSGLSKCKDTFVHTFPAFVP